MIKSKYNWAEGLFIFSVWWRTLDVKSSERFLSWLKFYQVFITYIYFLLLQVLGVTRSLSEHMIFFSFVVEETVLYSRNKNKSVLYFTIYFHYEALLSPRRSRYRVFQKETSGEKDVAHKRHWEHPHLTTFSTSSTKEEPSVHSKEYFLFLTLSGLQHCPFTQPPLHSSLKTFSVVWHAA